MIQPQIGEINIICIIYNKLGSFTYPIKHSRLLNMLCQLLYPNGEDNT